MDYLSQFKQYMNEQGIRFVDLEDGVIRISYRGKNINTINIIGVFGGNKKGSVQFSCCPGVNFPSSIRYRAYVFCNVMNSNYRWVRFYVDDEGDIMCETDVLLRDGYVVPCRAILEKMVDIVDETYPGFLSKTSE